MNELMHKSGLELPTGSNNMDRIKAHTLNKVITLYTLSPWSINYKDAELTHWSIRKCPARLNVFDGINM